MYVYILNIYFEREKESAPALAGEGQKEGEKENPKQALSCGAHSYKPWDHDLNWKEESEA